jgi:predicted DsbA family dithiol-disulfide isomerase
MQALHIDVVSDVVCPWCYVGKRRLESALQQWAQDHPGQPAPVVRWLPFQLNPDLDRGGMSRADYVAQKFGSRAASVYDRVTAVGASVGIPFNFSGIQRQPNTLKAHALIALAEAGPDQDRLVQALFDAYFIENLDLTDDAVLARIAQGAGVDAQQAQQALNDTGLLEQVAKADAQARSLGINGVPFFIFNGQIGVSGAQEPEQLLAAMAQAQANTQS